MTSERAPEPERGFPRERIVLLGASNLTLGLATAFEEGRRILGGSLEVLAAHGFGRSYGLHTRVCGRGLPSIESCGLWRALGTTPTRRTSALLTDLGNDLMYDVPLLKIVEWIRRCLDRLALVEARTVIVLPPLESIRTLGKMHFLVARTLLFPNRRKSHAEALAAAEELHAAAEELAREYSLSVIDPPENWYRLDPIHIRRACRGEAWQTFLAPWSRQDAPLEPAPPPPSGRPSLRGLRPEEWWLLGKRRTRKQPSKTLRDGSVISLY